MNANFTAFRALVRKDIQIFLRDRRALVVSVLTPIVVAAFFGFLFAGPSSGGSVEMTRSERDRECREDKRHP